MRKGEEKGDNPSTIASINILHYGRRINNSSIHYDIYESMFQVDQADARKGYKLGLPPAHNTSNNII